MSARPYYEQLQKYFRFMGGLRKFHQQRLDPQEAIDQARTFIRKRVDAREENFLELVEKGIFQSSDSPYLKLLNPRKISVADLKSWVSTRGLEGSLKILEQEGVYFTVDEFKGRAPVR